MRRLLFEKTGNAIWISHLDLMRLFQRAFKRAGLHLTHTQGFNPRPSVSIALPLSAFVPVKSTDLERELDFTFRAFPEGLKNVSFCWHVVHGDKKRVKVEPGENGKVHLSVDCRSLTGRIDVACFVKCESSDWGAPSFICIYPIASPATSGK